MKAMQTRRVVFFMLLAGLLLPVMAHAAALDDQVKAAYAAWDAAFNKGDPKAVAAFYADDAVLLPPNHEVIRGPDIEKFFAGLFGAGITGHKLGLIEANGGGDMAVGAATWGAKAKDGSAIGGVATHEFTQQPDGSLKLRLHTFN
jgi:ketosteroid isomerase-like protein